MTELKCYSPALEVGEKHVDINCFVPIASPSSATVTKLSNGIILIQINKRDLWTPLDVSYAHQLPVENAATNQSP